jgi:hypothetical protein
MELPAPRGPLSEVVFALMRRERKTSLDDALPAARCAMSDVLSDADPITDDDIQVTLWALYELHYAGFTDVDDRLEWNPGLIELRQRLELAFEAQLRARTQSWVGPLATHGRDLIARLSDFIEAFAAPSAAAFLQRKANRQQVRDYLVHRSVYHLKEADPHTWAIPRLKGRPKVGLAEIQYDEYGSGRVDRLHSAMFAETLTACGLSDSYGAYFDQVPGITLAVNNQLSLFGLNRRLRGAAVGHLAAFEATSSLPSRRIAAGLRRLGYPESAAAYYDEHVEADAVHEQVALRDICGQLAIDEPECIGDIVFGAASCLYLDGLAAGYLLERWEAGSSGLYEPELLSAAVGA